MPWKWSSYVTSVTDSLEVVKSCAWQNSLEVKLLLINTTVLILIGSYPWVFNLTCVHVLRLTKPLGFWFDMRARLEVDQTLGSWVFESACVHVLRFDQLGESVTYRILILTVLVFLHSHSGPTTPHQQQQEQQHLDDTKPTGYWSCLMVRR